MAKRVIFPSFDNPIVLFELTIDSNGVTSVTNKETGLPAALSTNAFDENTTVNPASTYMEQLISKVSTFILSAPDNTTFEVNNNNGTLSILNANTNTEVTSYSLSSIGATYPNVISSVLSTLDALIVSNGTNVTEISLPNTTTINGSVKLTNNPNLETIDVVSVTSVSGNIEIVNSGVGNVSFDFTNLTSIGGNVKIENNSLLQGFSLGNPTSCGDIRIVNNPSMSTPPGFGIGATIGNVVMIDNPNTYVDLGTSGNLEQVSSVLIKNSSSGLGVYTYINKCLGDFIVEDCVLVGDFNGRLPIEVGGDIILRNVGTLSYATGDGPSGCTFSGKIYIDGLKDFGSDGYEIRLPGSSISNMLIMGPSASIYNTITPENMVSNGYKYVFKFVDSEDCFFNNLTGNLVETVNNLSILNLKGHSTNGFSADTLSSVNLTIENCDVDWLTLGNFSGNVTIKNNVVTENLLINISGSSQSIIDVQNNTNITLAGEYGTCSTWTYKNNILESSVVDNPPYPSYIYGTLLDYRGCNITEVGIESLLSVFDGNGQTNKTLKLEGGTNAAPGATASGYITSLEGKGWTVTHN